MWEEGEIIGKLQKKNISSLIKEMAKWNGAVRLDKLKRALRDGDSAGSLCLGGGGVDCRITADGGID